jgi:hypothetical protein
MTYVVNGQMFSAYDLDPVRVQTYIRMLNGKHTLPDSDRKYIETFIKNYAISKGFVTLNSPDQEIILTKDILKTISKKAERHLKRLLSTFSKIQKGETNLIENQSAFDIIGQVVEVSDLHVESGQIIAGKAFMDLFDLVDSDQMSDILRLKSVFFRERLQNKYSLPKNSVVNGDFYDSVIYTRSGEKILVLQSSKDEYGN